MHTSRKTEQRGQHIMMIKEHLNYEENIMDFFRLFASSKHGLCFSHPLYLPATDTVKLIFQSIRNDEQWVKWHDSSGKDAPPPDYYNNELKLMMEVMRVDDNEHIDELTSKSIHPLRVRESELISEMKNKGILDILPPNGQIMIIANTKLLTDEDHNYIFYRDNFIRIIENHKEKIPAYQLNHPGFKTIFFVFDESSMYIKLEDGYSKNTFSRKRDIASGQLHKWCLDEAFLNTIINSEIDFLIWATPYKQLLDENGTEVELPGVCIFDIKNMTIETETYNERRMVSTHE